MQQIGLITRLRLGQRGRLKQTFRLWMAMRQFPSEYLDRISAQRRNSTVNCDTHALRKLEAKRKTLKGFANASPFPNIPCDQPDNLLILRPHMILGRCSQHDVICPEGRSRKPISHIDFWRFLYSRAKVWSALEKLVQF